MDLLAQRLESISDSMDLEAGFWEYLCMKIAPELYADCPVDTEVCKHPPGSKEKLETLVRRESAGLSLWNPQDATWASAGDKENGQKEGKLRL